MRAFLRLSYAGTHYAGWQVQPSVTTVQGSIEAALSKVFSQEISIVGCGRTDKGVHANYYIAHVDLPPSAELENIPYKLNRMLPADISCHGIMAVESDLHARYDAISRAYTYYIHFEKNPFKSEFSTLIPYRKKMDVEALNEVAAIILKTSDFTSFCKLHGSESHMRCQIMESRWDLSEDPSAIKYHIRANRFLRGMVRLIVGTSLSVSLGSLTLDELRTHIQEGTRSPLMKSAPPEGLSLTDVIYEQFRL